MLKKLISPLRRIKFNLTHLFGSDVNIPSEFKLFQRKETNYESFINQHLNYLSNKTVDLYDDLKIFGKDLKEYEDNILMMQAPKLSNKYSICSALIKNCNHIGRYINDHATASPEGSTKSMAVMKS